LWSVAVHDRFLALLLPSSSLLRKIYRAGTAGTVSQTGMPKYRSALGLTIEEGIIEYAQKISTRAPVVRSGTYAGCWCEVL
jgi:hypothetical protein